MALDDLLRVIPKHERERLMQVSASQRELLSFYAQLHSDISLQFADIVPQLSRGDLPLSGVLNASHLSKLQSFIEARVSTMNQAVAATLRASTLSLRSLIDRQIAREASAIGVNPSHGTPDPALLESKIEDAVQRIEQWNGALAPGIVRSMREGLARGETYRQIADRVTSYLRTSAGRPTPIARARAHMLQNTRYSIVSAANAARQDGYKQLQSNEGIKIRKMWWASISTCCPNCAKLHGQIVEIDQQFNWRDLRLTIVPFQKRLPHPPLHPNCRCRILPVTSDVLQSLDLSRVHKDQQQRLRVLAGHGVN